LLQGSFKVCGCFYALFPVFCLWQNCCFGLPHLGTWVVGWLIKPRKNFPFRFHFKTFCYLMLVLTLQFVQSSMKEKVWVAMHTSLLYVGLLLGPLWNIFLTFPSFLPCYQCSNMLINLYWILDEKCLESMKTLCTARKTWICNWILET